MLEMLTVCAIAVTLIAVSVMVLMPLYQKNHVDRAYDMTLSVLRTYRNMAITQYTRYIITVPTSQTITVQNWAFPPTGSTVAPAPVTVATINLPQDIQFTTQAGFPNPGPDSFGTGTTAVAFNACAILASGNPCVIFYPDGSAQDDASVPGNYNNGVVYLALPGQLYSSRAIDIWGTTGRIRGWRLYSVSGVNTWVQQ